LEISYSNSNNVISASSGDCSVRMRSLGKKSTHIGETKHVQSVSHPHTAVSMRKQPYTVMHDLAFQQRAQQN